MATHTEANKSAIPGLSESASAVAFRKHYSINKDDIQRQRVLERLEKGANVRTSTLKKYGIKVVEPNMKNCTKKIGNKTVEYPANSKYVQINDSQDVSSNEDSTEVTCPPIRNKAENMDNDDVDIVNPKTVEENADNVRVNFGKYRIRLVKESGGLGIVVEEVVNGEVSKTEFKVLSSD